MKPVTSIVLQPTSLCNLECDYCYLPEKTLRRYMKRSVLSELAEFVNQQGSEGPVSLIWHAGEPTATGKDRFRQMLLEFETLRKNGMVEHHIQTNATLIDEDWSQLFINFEFRVGVSIDGPEWANEHRVNRAGKETFLETMKGIGYLRKDGIPFSVISVVGVENLSRVGELYEFFANLGCYFWAVNLIEQEGVNARPPEYSRAEVQRFWEELFQLWLANPVIEIREVTEVLDFVNYTITHDAPYWGTDQQFDWLPTIAWDGTVYLVSPEFAGMESEPYEDFIAGNVLQTSLHDIIANGAQLAYVSDHLKGIELCRSTCQYFDFCGGGQASNKFFENGDIATTQTNFCRFAKQGLFDAVAEIMRRID